MHALVMDMDEGRDHHPWIVLASEWPSEHEEASGHFIHYVQDDDPVGILPGGRDWTSIAKTLPLRTSSEVPVLRQFGLDFEFGVVDSVSVGHLGLVLGLTQTLWTLQNGTGTVRRKKRSASQETARSI